MKQKKLHSILRRYNKRLEKYFQAMISGFDPDKIHDFRVEFKKYRAFCRMLRKEPASKLPISKNLRRAYRTSGALRDLQLQGDRIKELPPDNWHSGDRYLQELHDDQDQLKLQLIRIQFPDKAGKKGSWKKLPDKFSVRQFRDYAAAQWAEINALIGRPKMSETEIHRVRKLLKDLMYNRKYFPKESEVLRKSNWRRNDSAYVDKLLDQLGQFQDRCTAVSLLNVFYLTGLDLRQRTHFQLLKQQWLGKKQQLQKKLTSRLQKNGQVQMKSGNLVS